MIAQLARVSGKSPNVAGSIPVIVKTKKEQKHQTKITKLTHDGFTRFGVFFMPNNE